MKKLFFAALVAVAAVGSAYAFPVYNSTGTKIGDCIENELLDCSTTQTLYDAQGQPIPSQDLLERQFVPAAPTL
ncbi:hypothetical protein [Pedobacter africanus]|uniref:YD repeat-containing protein n=1 Tax=Pedobacter africanus TaxID=151894 RepID=A0A1W2DHS4_9SPHI|nr:hypothetical protein [Pedobacter africanus]SMC97101.1 hypothetical protein SAMN04488524_3843 [Pedobacter africanus]